MTRTTLLALASRVEAATGADREIDALIWCALNGKKYVGWCNPYGETAGRWTQVVYNEPPRCKRMVTNFPYTPHATNVTASLDAAMSLVPSGCAWSVEAILSLPEPFHAVVSDGLWLSRSTTPSIAATPALALTAACLRSRAIAGSLPD